MLHQHHHVYDSLTQSSVKYIDFKVQKPGKIQFKPYSKCVSSSSGKEIESRTALRLIAFILIVSKLGTGRGDLFERRTVLEFKHF